MQNHLQKAGREHPHKTTDEMAETEGAEPTDAPSSVQEQGEMAQMCIVFFFVIFGFWILN